MLKKVKIMKGLHSKRISVKISILVSLIIILAMGITGIESYNLINSNMTQSVHEDMKTRAKDKADIISAKISSYERYMASLAASADIRSQNENIINSKLREYKDEYGFLDLGYDDGTTNAVFASGKEINMSSEAFYTGIGSQKNVVISNPNTDDNYDKTVIMMAAPIISNDGDYLGSVVGVIDSKIVTEMAKGISVGKTGYCYVLDADGNYVASKVESEVNKNVFTEAEKNKSYRDLKAATTDIVSGKSDYQEVNIDGKQVCLSYAPIGGTKWFLTLRVPREEMFESVSSMLTAIVRNIIIFNVVAIILVLLICRFMITNPLKRILGMIEQMAKGRLNVRLHSKSQDELGRISESMDSLADSLETNVLGTLKQISEGDMNTNLKPLGAEDQITPELINTVTTVNDITDNTQKIIDAAKNGDLSKRCDVSNYCGSWKDLAEGVNGLMDSVSKPINEVRSVVEKMAVNDYSVTVSGSYNGLFKQLAEDINGVSGRLIDLEDVMVRVSKGDMSRLTEYKSIGMLSENDSLTPAVITMMENIDNLAAEVKHLVDESVSGNVFNTRGDADKFEGGYREVVSGFNDALDAMTKPIIEIRGILEAMAVNDFTKEISNEYKGDYLSMAKSMKMVQDNLESMQNVAVKISQGDISELETFRNIGKRSDNDMLTPAFTGMMESIKKLINEVTEIAKSAADGELYVRGNSDDFKGEYVGIMEAINSLLDAVAKPIGEVARVMTEISNSNFDASIEGNYKGEFEKLVSAVNKTAQHLKTVVSRISVLMLRLSDGDLSIDELDDFGGDFAVISKAVNQIVYSFNDLLGNINTASEQVNANAKNLSLQSQALSSGALMQASSVDELTSTISEISQKTGRNAENAAKASELAQSTMAAAATGNEDMQKMLKSIDEINLSSHDISKIVKVIDEIAFQTKILSINASVEAAHAGTFGKGFAVVASEVGNLALKSAKAAKETTDLIEQTIYKVKYGSKIANETAEALASIVEHSEDVAKLVSGIAEASKEQAQGISEVDKGIGQVSGVVQENSKTSQESAAASEQLSAQSNQLKQMIGNFKLKGYNENAGETDKDVYSNSFKSALSETAAADCSVVKENDVPTVTVSKENTADFNAETICEQPDEVKAEVVETEEERKPEYDKNVDAHAAQPEYSDDSGAKTDKYDI